MATPIDAPPVITPLIDGVPVAPAGESRTPVINPSTGAEAYSIPTGCAADIDRAVASARRSFDSGSWRSLAPSGRKRILHRLADLIADHAAELDRADARDMGKPVAERFGSAAAGAGLMHFYAEALDKITGDVIPSDKGSLVAVRRLPRGVVGAITPWNFPALNAIVKLAPALAAGNSVVLKPSELSPSSASRIAALALDAGLPPGILNVVPGLGETAGRALALHNDVDMIAFTGSTWTGKRMFEYAGQSNMKRILAECGGKSPHILFDDGVDLDAAADFIARRLLVNQGQICSLGSRLLVQRPIQKALVDALASRIRDLAIGDACDPDTRFGPLASSAQRDRVANYIAEAEVAGARLTRGEPGPPPTSSGFYVMPAIFSEVRPSARIAQEEIFGPVLAITPFDSEDEAAAIANGTIYGLGAYVWTARLDRAMRMADRISSSVQINAAVPAGEGAGFAAPCEPFGQSGVGAEGGMSGLESYLRSQRIWINHG